MRRTSTVILLLLGPLLLALSSCRSISKADRGAFQRAQASAQRNDWEGVIAELTPVIKRQPSYLDALLLRGRANFELRRFERATRDLEKVRTNPDGRTDLLFESSLYGGRTYVEQGRQLLDSPAVSTKNLKKARTLFVKANALFRDALRVKDDDYAAILWRAFCFFALENQRRALELFERCEQLAPGRWEHRFYSALSLEQLYGLNAKSLNTYFELAAANPSSERAPIYEHLIKVYPKVSTVERRKIFGLVESFANAVTDPSAQVRRFVDHTRVALENERRQARIDAALKKAERLVELQQFERAIEYLKKFAETENAVAEVQKPLRDAQEKWSIVLEAEAATLMNSGGKGDLMKALVRLRRAQKLTQEINRLGNLQQKINATELVLVQRETSRQLQEGYQEFLQKQYETVLERLSKLSVDKLHNDDKDLYHYLRGAAYYHLGRWRPAARSFARVTHREPQNLHLWHGLALVKSGDKNAGIAILRTLPVQIKNDEVHRFLALHYFDQKKFSQAAEHFENLVRPTPADSTGHLRCRESLGIDAYERGDHRKAIRELEKAKALLETELGREEPKVYRYLGHCHFQRGDHSRARRMYDAVNQMELSSEQRRKNRDIFVYRARIHLAERRAKQAFLDLEEFVRLGGAIPRDLSGKYAWLTARYADFMPLDKVLYWNYKSIDSSYSYSLFVKGRSRGRFVIERREGTNTFREYWSRLGDYLEKEIEGNLFKFPIQLPADEEGLPSTTYRSEGSEYTAELVAFDKVVRLPGGTTYQGCLVVRVRQTTRLASGKVKSTAYVSYFAPGVGEVRQEFFRDNKKVSEMVLVGIGYKEDALGN